MSNDFKFNTNPEEVKKLGHILLNEASKFDPSIAVSTAMLVLASLVSTHIKSDMINNPEEFISSVMFNLEYSIRNTLRLAKEEKHAH